MGKRGYAQMVFTISLNFLQSSPQIFNQIKEFPTAQSLFFGLAQRGIHIYRSLGHPEIPYGLQRGI
jgi:hypothetical protein